MRIEPVVEARGLIKRFKDETGVKGIEVSVPPAKCFGFLGPNGAGKTTTLRMLATILQPTDGSARVAGFDITEQPEQVRTKIGFLSTATALYGRLTARELVEYFGRLNGLNGGALRRRTDELFALLGISDFADRRCDKLSTGMKQKVSIARTLVHDPPVMIFDEPTVGLDVMAARTIVGFIRDCRDRGKTVIFSTHVMSEAEKLCDTIAIIHNGKLLAEGSLSELRARSGLDDLEEIFVRMVEGSPRGASPEESA